MKKAEFIWMDGELKPWEECNVHVMSHALHYGSSVFEGIRAYETPNGPAIFRQEDHIKRIFRSARMYRLDIPFDFETVCEACCQAVRENKLSAGYIRPLAFRGAGSVGVTAQDMPIHLIIAAFPWGTYLGEDALKNGVDVAVSSWNRLAPNTVPPGMKAGGNYLSSMLIGYEAKDRGVAEGYPMERGRGAAPGGRFWQLVQRQFQPQCVPFWKHSQYFLRQNDLRHLHPCLLTRVGSAAKCERPP